jgi:hypothetical protein
MAAVGCGCGDYLIMNVVILPTSETEPLEIPPETV